MDRGDGEGPSGDEEEERPESQRKPNVRPELAQLEDEDELNLEEPDRPVQRPDDYEDDEDVYQGMSSASTYIVPILLAGPFYIFNVWRACHWVVHRVISFPLDFIVTPLENSRSVRKSVNTIGTHALAFQMPPPCSRVTHRRDSEAYRQVGRHPHYTLHRLAHGPRRPEAQLPQHLSPLRASLHRHPVRGLD